MLQLFQWFR